MSKFTTPAILEMPGHYNWRVYEPFEFYLSDDNSDVISVPAGFVTDLASVPRIFWTRRQIRQSGHYPRLDVRQCATYKERSRPDIPGRNDGAGCAEVETDGYVLGGEGIWQGKLYKSVWLL